MTALGSAMGTGCDAYWSGTGRRLTPWEHSMRARCTSLWLPIDGAVYHLSLGWPHIAELEQTIGTGIGSLWARLPVEPLSEHHASALVSHAAHMVRLAILSGGTCIRDGVQRAVSPAMALEVAATIADGPLCHLWRIARILADVQFYGRPATAEETAAFSIPAGPLVVPAWALEYRA